jgi:eukaryotic-like serine/threonine-protein kinase
MNGIGKRLLWRFLTTIGLMLLLALVPVACGGTQTHSTPTPAPTPPGTTLYTLRAPTGTTALGPVVWSPDGKYIAAGTDYPAHVFVWDAHDGHLLLTYRGNSASVAAVAWSPDSKYIASGDTGNLVQVWDAKTGATLLTYNKQGVISVVHALAWSPDGKYIASASWDLTLQVWDAMTGNRIHTFQGASSAVVWSPDGRYIALGSIIKQGSPPEEDHNVHVLDASTWSIRLTYTGHSDRAEALAWSPDGKYLASGSGDKTVQVWKAP